MTVTLRVQRGYLLTAKLLKDAVLDKRDTGKDHNKERKAMVGKTLAPATYWVFEYTARLLTEYSKQKYQREEKSGKSLLGKDGVFAPL